MTNIILEKAGRELFKATNTVDFVLIFRDSDWIAEIFNRKTDTYMIEHFKTCDQATSWAETHAKFKD